MTSFQPGQRLTAAALNAAFEQQATDEDVATVNARLALLESTSTARVAPVNTLLPVIAPANAVVGQPMACTTGAWTGIPAPSFAFQWFRADLGAPIGGAGFSVYTPTQLDVGHTLRCEVTASNSAGSVAVSTAWTVPVVAVSTNSAPKPLSVATITGAPAIGSPLTASPGSWSGSPAPTFAYQWAYADTNALISGATGSTYTPVAADFGHPLKVSVTATNVVDAVTITSAATAAVPGVKPANVTPPSITPSAATGGTPITGTQLTANKGAWSGAPAPTFAYQWFYGDTSANIAGATGSAYVALTADNGHYLGCRVTATNAAGSTSADTNLVLVSQAAPTAVAPSPTASPTITGLAQTGSTLAATAGTWNGSPTPTYAYQWAWADTGAVIAGATGAMYVAQASDVGHTLNVTVTATNTAGAATAVSAPTAAISAPPTTTVVTPRLVSSGVVSGSAVEGATVSGSVATWDENPVIGVAPTNNIPPVIVGAPQAGQTLSIQTPTLDPTNLAGTADVTFRDEFDTLSLWNGSTGTWYTSVDWSPGGFWLGSEKEFYPNSIDSQFAGLATKPWAVANGVLSITAQATPSNLLTATQNQPYISGYMTTQRSFSQLYGYFEGRMKVPAGHGMWPQFWLLPSDGTWPPELDIFEWNGTNPGVAYSSTHSAIGGSNVGVTVSSNVNLSDGYHTVGAHWKPDVIDIYVDGVKTQTLTTPADMNKPMYLIVNLALDTVWDNNHIDGTTVFPAVLQVDYIRAYVGKTSAWSGTPTPSLSYQWKADGVAISGATAATYVVASAQVGKAISVTVTAANASGSVSVTSAATAPVSSATATVLDPLNTGAAVALTSGNKTGTKTADNDDSVRTVSSFTTQKIYCEYELTASAHGGGVWIGVGNSSATLGEFPGADVNGFGLIDGDTLRTGAGVLTAFSPSQNVAVGGRYRIAIDGAARLMWGSAVGGAWNNDPTANPVTGQGGVDISGLGASSVPLWLFLGGYWTGNSFTIKSAPSEWIGAAPSGFSALG